MSTKESILAAALELFNEEGLEPVSIRKIAQKTGISHGNLLYHFKDKEQIVFELHEQILKTAQDLNQKRIQNEIDGPLIAMLESVRTGFEVLYRYKFFMINLNAIMREYKTVRKAFLETEKIRQAMYKDAISRCIEAGLIERPLYKTEMQDLIERIRIFSDFWIASSEIYESGSPKKSIDKNVRLFASLLYRHATEAGRSRLDLYM